MFPEGWIPWHVGREHGSRRQVGMVLEQAEIHKYEAEGELTFEITNPTLSDKHLSARP